MVLSRLCDAKRYLVRRDWEIGFEPHYGLKTSSIEFEVVIRQCALKNCMQVFLGAKGK